MRPRNLGSRHFGIGSRSWGGRKAAISGSNFGGAPLMRTVMPSIKAPALSAAVEVSAAPVHAKEEIEDVIAAQAHTSGGGLILMPDPFTTTNHDLIVALAARYRVPTIYVERSYAESGGLISYGTDFPELFRQAAGYIDRILKGVKPGDLPIELPTKYELVVNLKSAKALGLTVPESVLSLADKVIE
jgi:putative tryptophan/tyrosine transport system substrate-binding protein